MRLPRIFNTTSFRLTLLYAALFCASVMLLFVAMYWYGTGYVAGQIDRTVSNEIAEVRESARGRGLKGLQEDVASYSSKAPSGVYYLLQDAHGRYLAGNISSLSPDVGIRSWPPRRRGGDFPAGIHSVRGRGVIVEDGAYFFVGLDAYELGEMREMIARAFIWGVAGTIFLALVGGVVMSLGLVRRVEAMSQTSREIMAGNLSRRIPIRGSDDEFDRLAASLNTMLDRIETLMHELREVTSDIAHDLRTPLTRLRQRLELASRRSTAPEELRAALENSAADVDDILETFAALLRIAQIEAHTNASELAPLDLTEVLSDMVETYQSVAEEREQRLVAELPGGLSIAGDRELLFQLFSNLIENAIRHCPSAATITLSARLSSQGVEVTIADDGPGIPAEMREKVFQRFYRLEHSRTTEGTGLGLSLAAAIAKLHGAAIDLSDNHPGLRVRLLFPAPYKSV
jgi:signal transduction histidine kinase